MICFLPFLFNLVLGLLIVIPASVHVMKLQQFNNIFYLLMLWLGISLLTSLFPLVEDALAMWESFYGAGNEANLAAKILLFPIIAVLVAGAYLERWGDYARHLNCGGLVPAGAVVSHCGGVGFRE